MVLGKLAMDRADIWIYLETGVHYIIIKDRKTCLLLFWYTQNLAETVYKKLN
jgi:hypothetical protein